MASTMSPWGNGNGDGYSLAFQLPEDLSRSAFNCDIVARDWPVRHGLARVVGTAFPAAAVTLHPDTSTLRLDNGSGLASIALWHPEGIDGVDILSQWSRNDRRVIGLGEPGAYASSGNRDGAQIAWVATWNRNEHEIVNAVARALAELDSTRLIQLPGGMRSVSGGTSNAALLTPRQEDVLRHLARGLSNAQIAQVLGMSENTVRIHVSAILKALRVTNRTQAALWATQNLDISNGG